MGPKRYGGKNTAKKGTFTRLLKLLFKNYKFKLLLMVICILVAAIGGSASSVFLKEVADVIQAGDWTGFLKIIAFMIIIYASATLAGFFQTRLGATITQGFIKDVRVKLFDKMQTLPIKYFDTHTHGDVMSVYTNDTDALRQLVSQSLPQIFSTILTLTFLVSIMLFYSIWLTLIVFVCVILMFFVTKKIGGNSAKYFIKQQKSLGKTEGFIEESINGQKVIKVFTHEKESKKDFDALNDEYCENSTKANIFANIMGPVMNNLGHLLYVIIAICGTLLVVFNVRNVSISGSVIGLSVIISFLPMSKQFTQSINQIAQQLNAIYMGLAGADRVFTLIDEESETDNGYVTLVHAKYDEKGNLTESDVRTGLWAWKHPHKADGTVTYTPLKGDIVMEEVDFSYVPEKLVLKDVSLHALPGQKIAFVGATGAGKTTITNLINRFYDIADGKIRYDGININKIKKSDLRRSLGIVLQDTNLFTGTVMDNIRYGKLDATDEECINAAKLANAHDFIERLPEGYNTVLTGDGANLSQGQRQLISIARAAVADAPVMIMDEATSSIDTRTELLVQKGTDRLMEGRTVFIIAHRLSTVRNADVITVLDHGQIIERGTHQELLDKKGSYYQLYTGAFELD
ncbi:MAG: ABC transporter ATP-binding protein [Clostridia bacterium]|nr:ABC transporter ATP-binding protein [Clostridia bacterium]